MYLLFQGYIHRKDSVGLFAYSCMHISFQGYIHQIILSKLIKPLELASIILLTVGALYNCSFVINSYSKQPKL